MRYHSYKDLIHMAELLGDKKAVSLLTNSLHEEVAANQKPAELGEKIITPKAVRAAQAM